MAWDWEWPEIQAIDALQAHLFGLLKPGAVLDVGLVTCDVGDWDIPAPDVVATLLPALIIAPGDIETDLQDLGRGSIYFESTIELNFLRVLGQTERKNYAIKQDSAKIKKSLTPQNLRGFPGWLPAMSEATKFVPAFAYCRGGGVQEGFFYEDPALDIEHEIILLRYGGDLYFKDPAT